MRNQPKRHSNWLGDDRHQRIFTRGDSLIGRAIRGGRDRWTDGERKTVTALFADIKGSAALMETLDPVEAHAVVDPVLRIMVEAVHRYEGYIARTTGDGIFALFGAPVAHEDHPQLAAALRLQQELHAHGQRRIAQGLHPLEARVGVHTGEVVAHSVETDGKVEYRLVGHTANLAARMEMVAPTGSVATLVAGRFHILHEKSRRRFFRQRVIEASRG